MQFIVDPSIATKIAAMKQRVCWNHPAILERSIDQTRLSLGDPAQQNPDFSFLVIGDSGSSRHPTEHPQRRVAEAMLDHVDDCAFVIHTGDVVYLVGSREQYPENFIEPYRELLLGGNDPSSIAYDQMIFTTPFFPVPGNHDYYDLPKIYGALAQMTLPLRQLFNIQGDLDLGWHGSEQGDAYARAFLDYLKTLDPEYELAHHLDHHYSATSKGQRCIHYQPGSFTRLPNRYYTFNVGGIDFFALDSNTFITPLRTDQVDLLRRSSLDQRQQELAQQRHQILETIVHIANDPDQEKHLADLYAELEEIKAFESDIIDQGDPLDCSSPDAQADGVDTQGIDLDLDHEIDREQLQWLEDRLIESWQTNTVRGRILFMHHPAYATEITKWDQAETLAVRLRLRQVFKNVADQIGSLAEGRPLVDLILTGHAHCLDYLRTENTGYADSYLNWITCGGSGFSLRRQKSSGSALYEQDRYTDRQRMVARSELFVGRNGYGSHQKQPYSFLRIDVQSGSPAPLILRPYTVENIGGDWKQIALSPIPLPQRCYSITS